MREDPSPWAQLSLFTLLALAQQGSSASSAGSGDPPRIGSGKTLTEFLHWLRDERIARYSDANFAELEVSCRHFDTICAAPPVSSITRGTLGKFVDGLEDLPGLRKGTKLSPNTTRKHYFAVQGLLKLAIEEGELAKLPELRAADLPPPDDREPRAIPLTVLKAIYHACSVATCPQVPGVRPEAWWRGLLCYLYFTSVRRGHLIKTCADGYVIDGLCWDRIDLETGLIRAPRSIHKCRRRETHYLPEVLRWHLTQIKPTPGWHEQMLTVCRNDRQRHDTALAGRLVFPWYHVQGAGRAEACRFYHKKHLYRCWHAIQDAAGVKPDLEYGYYDFHEVRKSVGTAIADQHGDQVAARMLGHSVDVFRKHYDCHALERRASVMEGLPSWIPPELMGGVAG